MKIIISCNPELICFISNISVRLVFVCISHLQQSFVIIFSKDYLTTLELSVALRTLKCCLLDFISRQQMLLIDRQTNTTCLCSCVCNYVESLFHEMIQHNKHSLALDFFKNLFYVCRTVHPHLLY